MNSVFFFLIITSVIAASFNGSMAAVTTASIESAKAAVTLAIGLIGVMAFWLGMMKIVQEAGLMHSIARGLRPVMTRLFPDVPADHPAMSAMIMNMASNMLGLGNAATPFGIKAMTELNRLNPNPGVATNAMALFLAINTSNVALAPLGVIAFRASLGSENAAAIWFPTLLATSFSTLIAVIAAKSLQGFFKTPELNLKPTLETKDESVQAQAAGSPDLPESRRSSSSRVIIAWSAVAIILIAAVLFIYRETAGGHTLGETSKDMMSTWLLPALIAVMLLYGFSKKVPLYETMIEGAREGFDVAVRIIPFLVSILVAAGMFRASGMLELVIRIVSPLTDLIGFPAEALPMAILRPLSGSGAYGIMADTLRSSGPDSFVGYLVSTLQGSTETTFYVAAVYFGAVGITRFRHALAAGLIADAAGIFAALAAVRLLLA